MPAVIFLKYFCRITNYHFTVLENVISENQVVPENNLGWKFLLSNTAVLFCKDFESKKEIQLHAGKN